MSRGDIHVSNTFETSLIAVVRALAKSAAAAVLRRLLLLSDLHMTFVAWFRPQPPDLRQTRKMMMMRKTQVHNESPDPHSCHAS